MNRIIYLLLFILWLFLNYHIYTNAILLFINIIFDNFSKNLLLIETMVLMLILKYKISKSK